MIPPDHDWTPAPPADTAILLAAIQGQLHALRVSVDDSATQLRLLASTQRTVLQLLSRIAGKPSNA